LSHTGINLQLIPFRFLARKKFRWANESTQHSHQCKTAIQNCHMQMNIKINDYTPFYKLYIFTSYPKIFCSYWLYIVIPSFKAIYIFNFIISTHVHIAYFCFWEYKSGTYNPN
jgi:hypothetical protein